MDTLTLLALADRKVAEAAKAHEAWKSCSYSFGTNPRRASENKWRRYLKLKQEAEVVSRLAWVRLQSDWALGTWIALVISMVVVAVVLGLVS